jgi:polyhydroxybutyrate depolymerase
MKILKICSYTFTAVALLVGMVACGQTPVPPTATPTAIPSPTAIVVAATLQPTNEQRTLTVDGVERTYLLHVPPGLDSSQPTPVFFALHGFDTEKFFEITDLQNVAGFEAIADQGGFILVYPSGLDGVWNIGGGCCSPSVENNVDEAAFIRQILTDLGSVAKIDPKRIYAAGFSMGGMLAFKLGCEMSDTFAGVASVAGSMIYEPCQPDQPVSVFQVNGKADTLVPYDGGVGGFMTGITDFPAAEQVRDTWAQLDGCTGTPQTEDQGVAILTAYDTCQDGTAVELYTMDALANNWPTQYVLPVSQMIWDFFAAHPKP